MKGMIITLTFALALLAGCTSETTKTPETAGKAESPVPSRVTGLRVQVRQQAREGKTADALATLNELITLEGENRSNLGMKHELLMKLERYDDALKAALRRDEITERKSPWNTMPIVETLLKMGQPDRALKYLKVAVMERGFIYRDYLDQEIFDPLRKRPEFLQLLKKMGEMIGINQPARDFTVPLLGGGEFSLAAQRGKVVLVDFWASWCPPCRREMPFMKQLYSRNAAKGLVIIGISLDKDEAAMKEFIARQQIDWNIAFSGKNWADDTVRLYRVSSIPSTFLVDRRGVLRHFNLHGAELEKAVQALLGQE